MASILDKLASVQSFGGIDASNDDILLEAFEDHEVYKSAINFSKTLIIGRKGAGKSAIFRKITSESCDRVKSLGFVFSDYPWEHHSKQKQSGVPNEECYRESWKYFICLMLCKLVLSNRQEFLANPAAQSAFSDLDRFIRDSYGDDLSLARIFTPGQQIKLSGRFSLLGSQGEVRSINVEHLPTHYSEVNRNILDALFLVLPDDCKFYVCFDELDYGFNPKDSDYLQRLIGLIRAAKYTNDRFKQAGLTGAVIILLRDDIWHSLRFEDKNKLAQDQLAELRWSKAEGPHCIKKLMERRFHELLGDEASWEKLFNEQRAMAQLRTKYDYICERSFLRPRDVIQYCNEVLKVFKKEGGNCGFDNELVRKAEESYSRYFMQELEDELHKHSTSYENYFEVLKGLSNVNFTKEEFDAVWETRGNLFDQHESPEKALNALFDFSIVGYLATGGKGAGSKYIWHYLEPRIRFNSEAKSYKVHLGLKQEFDLRLYARRKKTEKS